MLQPSDPGDCGNMANAFVTTISFGYLGTDCVREEKVDARNQHELYTSHLSSNDAYDSIKTLSGNNLQYVRSEARAIISNKTRVGIEKGWNETYTESVLNESLDNYYSKVKLNAIRNHNSIVAKHTDLLSKQLTEDIRQVAFYDENTGNYPYFNSKPASYHNRPYVPYKNATYTLPNGSETRYLYTTFAVANVEFSDWLNKKYPNNGTSLNTNIVRQLSPINADNSKLDFNSSNSLSNMPMKMWNGTETITVYRDLTVSKYKHAVGVSPSSYWDTGQEEFIGGSGEGGSQSEIIYSYDPEDWNNLLNDIDSQLTNQKQQGANLIKSTVGNESYTMEDYDRSEWLTPGVLVELFNTKYDSTGNEAFQCAQASSIGVSASTNHSFTVVYDPDSRTVVNDSNVTETVNPDPRELEGCLFSNWDPHPQENAAFKTGIEYQTSNTSKSVYFAIQSSNVSDQQTGVIEMDGTFRITEMVNVKTGETTDSTGLDNDTVETVDRSSYLDQLRNLSKTREEILEKYSTAGTGGGGGDGGSGQCSGLLCFNKNPLSSALNSILAPFAGFFDKLLTGVFRGLIGVIVVGLILLLIISD
jgi:hypothetical protein